MSAAFFFAGRVPSRWGAMRRVVASGTAALALMATASCKYSEIPYYVAPSSIQSSPAGVQSAVTGLFGKMRNDDLSVYLFGAGFARDALVFLSGDENYASEYSGIGFITENYGDDIWNIEFANARQANVIIAALPSAVGFTPAQVAAVTGVVQTAKALEFMELAEFRDTIGIPIYSIVNGTSSPPYCNQDVWKYIVALLDSGFADLNTAGAIPLPITLPNGFASVGATAAPSTTQGSFAAFNRALAGKAGLELAYALARSSAGTRPTPTSPGAPDVTALTRADSALTASALYNPSAIAPPVAGPFALDPYGVYHTFSTQSGDNVNPLNVWYPYLGPLYDLAADVDTANDLRWKNKFVAQPIAFQIPQYSIVALQMNYLPLESPNSPLPIVRAEELALVGAEIDLGLGNYPGAINLINTVHMQAGGFSSPLSIAPTYTAVRDTLMKELRISTVLEGSVDHLIAIRMWGMAAVSDTTWDATSGPDAIGVAAVTAATGTPPVDLHTIVAPSDQAEVSGRNGNYTLSCP